LIPLKQTMQIGKEVSSKGFDLIIIIRLTFFYKI
jgi:hypothetical protein